MPDARTHDRIGLVTGLALAPVAYTALQQYGETPEQAFTSTAILVAAHWVGTYWLSPDLDLDSRIDDRWGPLFWIWRPYMWAVPHRRFFSHSGVSALLRLLYLYTVVGLLLLLAGLTATALGIVPERSYYAIFEGWVFGWLAGHPHEARLIAAGAVLSDLVHTLADYLVTGGKGLLRALGLRLRRDYRNHDRYIPRAERRRRRV